MQDNLTIGELISQVRVELKKANVDDRSTDRALWSVIDKHRTWLAYRQSDKTLLINSNTNTVFQTKKCVEVIDAPVVDECCGLRGRCTIKRSKDKIPPVMEDSGGAIIKSVYSVDGSTEWTLITIYEYMRKLENTDTIRYDNSQYYFYNNGYLYFPKSNIRLVEVKAYFKQTVVNDCQPNANKCIIMQDQPARIPPGTGGELMKYVLAELLPGTRMPEDMKQDKNPNFK